MQYKKFTLFLISTTLIIHIQAQAEKNQFYLIKEFSVDQEVGLLRAVPVELGNGRKGIFMAYSADKDIDPYVEMFYPPTDRLKFEVVDLDGNRIWKKEIEPGIFNGIWFVPIYPFDLDSDGVDEIYYVTNIDSVHILSIEQRRLKVLDALTGNPVGLFDWPNGVNRNTTMSHAFRNFIFGGFVDQKPVLLTAQGTYGQMSIQAWNVGMSKRWDKLIEEDDPGARGSHQTPVVDINMDGSDEFMWGERCIQVDDGEQLFIADQMNYVGHSDIIQPTLNRSENRWYFFTCRESDDRGNNKPRVVMYDNKGEYVWSDLENGHMDMGWTAHTGGNGESIAYTISRAGKRAGPDGFFRLGVEEYVYDSWTGDRIELNFDAYNTIPVDLDGDGNHEFACGHQEQSDWNVYDKDGRVLGSVGEKGYIAMASKFLDLPGEQILCYYPNGTIKIWGMKNAKDNEIAIKRYNNSYYKLNQKLTAVGYNMVNLGGL